MATHKLNRTRTDTWVINKDHDIWILGEDGRIAGNSSNAIADNDSITEATIRIKGKIDMLGPSSSGIYLGANAASITIEETGYISANYCIFYSNYAGSITIDNFGSLLGYSGISIDAAQSGADIRNAGAIHVTTHGIAVGSARASIINSGIIDAQKGITVSDGASAEYPLEAENATHIVNTGKVTGSDYAIGADGVAVNIRNKGTLSGDVVMGEGNDVFNTAGGTFKGVLYGGAGNDVVTLASPAMLYVENFGEGVDTLRINSTYRLGAHVENLMLLGKANHTGIGNSLDNVLTGNRGDNALYGLDGDDLMNGGRGRDNLSGGDGADSFLFSNGCGHDTIMDFEDGTDLIALQFSGIFTFDDLVGKMSQSDDETVIRFSDTDVLVLRGTINLTESDFEF